MTENGRSQLATPARSSTAARGNGAKAAPAPRRRTRAQAAAKAEYTASIYPGPDRGLPAELTELLVRLEATFGCPLWILIQQHPHEPAALSDLNYRVHDCFFRQRKELKDCGRVALVIESPGGYARSAYQIAKLFKRHCGGFDAIVPSYAKSAATLLTLGADRIFMGFDAELGPLDVQLRDPDREQIASALDEVAALERLHSVALSQMDQTMMLMLMRTEKKTETLLPLAMTFAAQMIEPLLDKIDTVHYTQQSRILKEAEDYAIRLLADTYGDERAEDIARQLVNNYPEHGFVIDRDEANSFLDIAEASDDQMLAIGALEDFLHDSQLTVIGRFQRKEGNAGNN